MLAHRLPQHPSDCQPVPHILKDAIGCELEKLVSQGVFRSANYSKWAIPIVSVTKTDGVIRICGDFKMTVNKVVNCDKFVY